MKYPISLWGMVFALSLATTVTSPEAAHAGGATSGGGGSILCRDQNHKIISAKLYDTFEAQAIGSHTIKSRSGSADIQLNDVLGTLNNYVMVAKFLRQSVATIFAKTHFLPDGIFLPPPTDLGNERSIIIPEGCELGSVAHYDNDGNLLVASTVFKLLSPTDQAAFFLHETLYMLARAKGATDSAGTRDAVADLFSTNPQPSKYFEAFYDYNVGTDYDVSKSLCSDLQNQNPASNGVIYCMNVFRGNPQPITAAFSLVNRNGSAMPTVGSIHVECALGDHSVFSDIQINNSNIAIQNPGCVWVKLQFDGVNNYAQIDPQHSKITFSTSGQTLLGYFYTGGVDNSGILEYASTSMWYPEANYPKMPTP